MVARAVNNGGGAGDKAPAGLASVVPVVDAFVVLVYAPFVWIRVALRLRAAP